MKKQLLNYKSIFIGSVMVAALVSCSLQQPNTNNDKEKVNILLIVSEDNGPELSCYGVKDVKTPVLDGLASRGVRFENAFVTYSVCSPSRGTIFTGLYPHQNGQIGLATHKYRMLPNIKTLPVFLKEAGYRTGCLGKIHVNPEPDIPFDYHPIKDANFGRKDLWRYDAFADSFFHQSDKPFFLMVNYPDAHFPLKDQVEGMPAKPMTGEDVSGPLPFIGADSYRLRAYTAQYYNSIERLDEMVGKLLQRLDQSGKANNTLVIYLGDHGAQFSRGKCSSYDAGLKVPLIIYWPGKTSKGLVQKELVSSIDLLPTILETAGIVVPENLPGKSWTNLMTGKAEKEEREFVYADNEGSAPMFYHPQRSIRSSRYKLIHNLVPEMDDPHFTFYANHIGHHFDGGTEEKEIEASSQQIQDSYKTFKHPPEYELYDLEKDPYEFTNVADNPAYQSTLESLKKQLQQWQKETTDPLSDKKILAKMTDEVNAINKKYPKQEYTKDSTFQWQYPDYFEKYIKAHKGR